MRKSILLRCLALCLTLCTALGCLAVVGSGAENDVAVDLDNDAGSLTYTVSEDGSTVTITYLLNGETVSYTVPNNHNYTSGGLVGTDDLGRKLYTTADENVVSINSKEGERYVGLFYFLWHGEHGDSGVFELQKILDEQGAEVAGSISQSGKYGPVGAMHWFAEPLYGYYYANDEWVHRKHAELLTQANVDFLYFDVTNGYYYLNNALSVMKACHELNEQGFDAPQVVFYTHTGAANVVRGLYNDIYSKGLYEDTWFRIDGKPVIIAPYEANIDDFFTIKREQWPNEDANQNSWPWMDFTWPARVFNGWDSNMQKDGRDAISVSVAQHSGNTVFSTSSLYGYISNRGRSFNADKSVTQTLRAAWKAAQEDPTLSYQGLNFQAQWDRAIAKDVTYVLVTGWNEWVAQRQPGSIIGNDDKVAFVDTFSIEYSRDTEMMRGGYFDNYYMQLAFNIQRYKGTAPIVVQDSRKKIDVTGDFAQWDSVQITYRDLQGDTQARNGKGFGNTTYTNDTGRNDIIASKVTSDTKNVYFYVETAEAISMPDANTTWMQLFINVDNDSTGWYGYDYIVNFSPRDTENTTVAKYVGNGTDFDFANCADVSYKIDGNRMMIAVPQSALGIAENRYRELCLQFKWVDSTSVITTMEQFYEDGDCAPLGRMNYVYQNYIPGVSEVKYPELETETETQTDAPTEAPNDTATDVPDTVTTAAATDTETGAASGGCSSAVAPTAFIAFAGLCGGAVLTLKRRERK